jgi:hypothetical protein
MVCGSDQFCAGTKMGVEVTILSVDDLMESNVQSNWGLLTIDATNAFNCINRILLL